MNDKLKADMRAATDRNETIVLSGRMVTPTISNAEREATLKASAMLSLADYVEARRLDAIGATVRASFTLQEMDLITHALRHTADSDN